MLALSLPFFLSHRYLDLPKDLLIFWTWLEKFLSSHYHWFFYFGGCGKKIGMKASQTLEKLLYASKHILCLSSLQVVMATANSNRFLFTQPISFLILVNSYIPLHARRIISSLFSPSNIKYSAITDL